MIRLVGITGKAGSGKSTAAQALVDAGWVRVKFAAPLKNMCRALGMTDDMIEGDLKETPIPWLGDRTPRYVMQTLGTEWGRNIVAQSLWTDIAAREVEQHLEAGRKVVIDDCRFENEAETVRRFGGQILRVVGRGGVAGDHVSERLVGAEIEYNNIGTEKELRGFMHYAFVG